ncbi:hypothetical protein QGX21_gp147 [Pseudomonas phage phiPsa315]|uniref:Cyanophage baseplate Pam3 plug gp18 domain-containing protein n=1 Tax=Pseudomonas phage phiPsa315 TaxID=1460363 RepID=A0A7G9V1Y8_9CAUD|nr:hypothetical protein QGX21_gp147 [Pseudomonas phage phiPsa315]QNO00294.1 hypothetical protein phiPsa315_079 [Pseudomonas phage phiPsa315]
MATTVSIEMPLYEDLKYRYGLSLQGQSWQFTFYWNTRCSQWHMDLRREDQTPIILGYALVPQYPMMVDYNLEDVGLTGYFLLLPINATIGSKITEEPSIMPQFFSLFYVYNTE